MSDDGTGGGIRIPSMVISKADGLILMDFLKRASDEEIEQLAIMAEFIMDKPDDRVEYDIWFTSSNDHALDFISDFKDLDSKFADMVLMEPHYVFWRCTNCEQQYLQNDCYGGGKYCAMEPSDAKIKGKEIIQEDLREKCLYNKFYSDEKTRYLWWAYMKFVHQNCYNVINEDCSISAHKKLSLNFEETKQCVENSFSSSDWDKNGTTNSMIDTEIEYWKKFGSGIYPSIVINNRTFRGQLESLSVFNAICAGFLNPPRMCLSTLSASTPDFIGIENDGIKGSVVVVLVLVLILVNVMIVYCYRRYSKREMQQDMKIQIESAVSQYFALSQRSQAYQS